MILSMVLMVDLSTAVENIVQFNQALNASWHVTHQIGTRLSQEPKRPHKWRSPKPMHRRRHNHQHGGRLT